MDNPHGILIFGASGSGTTTIGRELARLLDYEHHDIDDYVWEPTNPPYTIERSIDERVALLRTAIKGNFVLSGCLREWGGAFDSILSVAAFVKTPTSVRQERLNKRELGRYGERINPGGDLYQRHQKFMQYIASYDTGGMETRSLASQGAWAKTLTCPVVNVNGEDDYRKTAKILRKRLRLMKYAQTAKETVRITDTGIYIANDKPVDISEKIAYTNNHTVFISQQDADKLESEYAPKSGLPIIELHDESTLAAIIRLADTGKNLGALNFASAKNPCGGFLKGAMAQEESLAAASALYPAQLKATTYYAVNRRYESFTYTDSAIWSPDVVFFRDDNANLLPNPVTSSVLTIPGVNYKEVIKHGEDTAKAKAAMKRRMKIALAIFANKGCDTIILGAFGCGVFQNAPADVATWWSDLLHEYGGHFEKIVFSVLDRSRKKATYSAFSKILT